MTAALSKPDESASLRLAWWLLRTKEYFVTRHSTNAYSATAVQQRRTLSTINVNYAFVEPLSQSKLLLNRCRRVRVCRMSCDEILFCS
jgi:hypothetical protein